MVHFEQTRFVDGLRRASPDPPESREVIEHFLIGAAFKEQILSGRQRLDFRQGKWIASMRVE